MGVAEDGPLGGATQAQTAAWWLDAVRREERRGELLAAFDLAGRGLAEHPDDVRLKHRAVLALARAGATEEAARRFALYGLDGIDSMRMSRRCARGSRRTPRSIDGSLVDNLPVRAMADMSEGPVIAVDVKATFERKVVSAHPGDGLGATPRREAPPPSLGETVTRLLLLGSANTSEAAGDYTDLVIKPRAEGVGLFEFHQLDAARQAGRDAARTALESLPSEVLP